MTVDGRGNVYVSDASRDRIVKLSPTGRVLARWSLARVLGSFDGPGAIAAGAGGVLYVLDPANDAVVKLSSSGRLLAHWGNYGHRGGQLSQPSGLAVDGAGDVYVADTGNNRIQKFSSAGKFLAIWDNYRDYSALSYGGFSRPEAVAVDRRGRVLVADTGHSRVVALGPNGNATGEWPGRVSGRSRLDHPEGIAVDGRGNVFIADTRNRRVVALTTVKDGLQLRWTSSGPIARPQRVAAGDAGSVYLVGLTADTVVKLSARGAVKIVWRGW